MELTKQQIEELIAWGESVTGPKDDNALLLELKAASAVETLFELSQSLNNIIPPADLKTHDLMVQFSGKTRRGAVADAWVVPKGTPAASRLVICDADLELMTEWGELCAEGGLFRGEEHRDLFKRLGQRRKQNANCY